MSKIIKRCQEVRTKLQPYIMVQRQAEIAKHQNRLNAREKCIKDTLSRIYKELEAEIYNGCGNNFFKSVCVSNHFLSDPDVSDAITQHYGLELAIDSDVYSGDYIHILPQSKIKLCTIYDPQKQRTLELDFPALLQEDQNRALFWKTNLLILAKQTIDHCRKSLEENPHNYYGIPWQTYVCDANHHNAFHDQYINFSNLEISYDNLNRRQREELENTMNQLIAHARVEIDKDCEPFFSNLWIKISKDPEKILNEPYFDYADFYQKYEKITPQLQKHFDHIAKHLDTPSAESQFLTLSADQKLTYWFSTSDGPDYDIVQKATIKNPSAATCLLPSFLETVYPGLKITTMLFKHENYHSFAHCGNRVHRTKQRIEFTYEVTRPDCQIARNALHIAEEIDKIKISGHYRAGRELIKQVLVLIDRYIEQNHIDSLLRQSSRIQTDNGELIVTINNHAVDLSKVTDQRFLEHVSNAVYDQSNKLISAFFIKDNRPYFTLHL